MKTIKKLIIALTVFLFSFVIILFIFQLAGYRTYIATSSSMEPTYHPGDLLIYNVNVDMDVLEIGDIIAFEHDGDIVTHRIADKTVTGKIVTKGDNNNHLDGFLTTKDTLIAKEVFYISHYMGYIFDYFIDFIRAYALLLCVFRFLLKYKQERNKRPLIPVPGH